MQVSIIVSVYNSASYLPYCIESLQSQAKFDYEILFLEIEGTYGGVS